MIYEDILHTLEKENRLRSIPGKFKGMDLVSNDYMGLGARCREFMEEYRARFEDAPMSASASRLLQRSQSHHNALEALLDSLYGKRSLLFNSGYHANVGALSALSLPGTLIVSDKLSHASMIDGIRLGGGDSARFAHNDMTALRRVMSRKAASYRQVVIVTESVFSMDGDLAPLHELIAIKKEYPGTMLYLDEAHAFGVFGDKGLGLAEHLGVIADIDIIIGTLGKAAAGCGAFIAASPAVHDYLLNSARSFIFSTALPPAVIAWDMLMIEHLIDMRDERRRLHDMSEWFRAELERITGFQNPSRSQIIPVHAGSAEKAIEMAARFRECGIDALPIRRPTVAAGTERLRLSLSADLTRENLLHIISTLEMILTRFRDQ